MPHHLRFLLLLLLAGVVPASETTVQAPPWSLYAFDNGLNERPDVPTPLAKAALLKKLGYSGMTTRLGHLTQMPELLAALDGQGLALTSIYYVVDPEQAPPEALHQALATFLRNRPLFLEIAFVFKERHRFRPSDPAADDIAINHLKTLASWCEGTRVRLSFYPHKGMWNESLDDSMRLIRKAGIPDLGTNLNLVHWWTVKPRRPIAELIPEIAPYLRLVSIHGLDQKTGAIHSLGEGDFDVTGFLAAVKSGGYHGPIGLQSYSVKSPSGTAEEPLGWSMEAWRGIHRTLFPPAP